MQAAAGRHTYISRAERSYLTSEVRGSGLECQAVMVQERPRGATLHQRSVAAERRHSASEVSGSREETPRIRGQGQQEKATSRPRPGAVTLRSHPDPEARGCSWEEPPTPEARAGGWEEQPEEPWLSRHRRA